MTGSLQIKSDKFYAVLNFKDESGKRVQKWVPLNLPARGNKRKAEAMLADLINEYQGLESVEPVNRPLSQHIAMWIERDRPHIAMTTYNYFCWLRQRQMTQMQLCGACYNREYLDFVCVDEMGMLLQPDFVSQKFQQILVKYGLRPIRFHDLRHSCATIMLYLNYTMKDVQQWLGHSNYNFTASTYVHSSKQAQLQMAESFADRLPAIGPVVTVEG